MKKVGVILLNYNNYTDTEECLESLLKISYVNYKIYVVDNCSTDSSFTQLTCKYQENNRIILIQSGKNGGFSFGNNIGIKAAIDDECCYILILNNDTIVDRHFLTHLMAAAEKDPSLGVLTGKGYYYDKPNMLHMCGGSLRYLKVTYTRYGADTIDNGQFDSDRYIDFASMYFALVRADVFEEVGLLNENYFGGTEETDFNYKVSKTGSKIFYVHKSKIWHKIGGTFKSGLLRSTYMAIRNKFLFVKEHYKLHYKIIWMGCYSTYLLVVHVPKRFMIEISRGRSISIFSLYRVAISAILDGIKSSSVSLADYQKYK